MNFPFSTKEILIGAALVAAAAGVWRLLRVPAAHRLSLEEFDRKRSEPGVVVLDVRTPSEFASGHVPGAVNLNVMSGEFDPGAAKLDKATTYLVHCARGGRSAVAFRKMAKKGFSAVYEFPGGWNEWTAASKPVER